MGKPIDLTGLRFGKWLVIEKAKSKVGYEHQQFWLCRCDCGVEQIRKGGQLRYAEKKGANQCCAKCSGTKHGEFRKSEYIAWNAMIDRCSRAKHPWFHRYGGRGISVCERWMIYDNFLADMGRKPTPKHSIDRINNDGNYEPSNCEWVTQTTQLRNTSVNRIIEFNGKSQCLKDWSEETGISSSAIKMRIDVQGWSIEDALTIKAGKAFNWRGTTHKDSELITYNGESLPHSTWAKRLGISRDTIRNRLKRGWTVEKAVTTRGRS